MINVLVSTDTRYPVNRKVIRRAVATTLEAHGAGAGDVEVSVSVVGERKMDQLCKKYMNDGKKHEVLSFPFEDTAVDSSKAFMNSPDGVLRLGDIILCWGQVLLAAARDGVMVDDEVYLLTAHSTEHLLGKHHE
ncbi:MAG TPA: rRNA maturation RNase YbeY [Candidatus Saccharimonadales bacterium]|nr:rRNA maturation RNase YbeY [Candidatus Saccharimonadales bacterium]